MLIETTFHLTGANKGRTVRLGSKKQYHFVDGKMTASLNAVDTALVSRFLQRNWQAYPEGHPALKVRQKNGQRNISKTTKSNSKSDVQSGDQSEGKGTDASLDTDDGEGAVDSKNGPAGLFSAGDGQAPELNKKLLRAVESLDQANDKHWTPGGKPDISTVTKLYGATDVTRADIEDVAPGFVRPVHP